MSNRHAGPSYRLTFGNLVNSESNPLPLRGKQQTGKSPMNDAMTPIGQLRQAMQDFVAQRHWEPFHTPKNLVMALSVEASELVEIFQWLTPEESLSIASHDRSFQHVKEEMADICCYLFSLANQLDIDLTTAIREKMVKNEQKYPIGQSGQEKWRIE